MNATALAARVNAAIKRVGGMDRDVYLRVQQSPTGDALIGRGFFTTQDLKINPQPVYRQLGKREMIYLSSIGHQVTADDYKITFSPASVTLLQLRDQTAQIVLRDPNYGAGPFGGSPDEILRILYVDPQSYGGQTVLVTVLARSVYSNA